MVATNAVFEKRCFGLKASPESRNGYKSAYRLARQQKCLILKGTGMKKPFEFTLLILLVVGVSFGQTSTTRTEKKDDVRSQVGIAEAIIAREEGFWDAWKNRRADFFKENLAAESIIVTGTGRRTKAETLEEVAKSDCVVKDYSLANFKTLRLGNKTTLVTYYVQQRITCGGKEQAQRVYASSIYVAPSGPLLRVFHQKTVASK